MGIYNEYYQKYYSSIKKQENGKEYTPQRYNGTNSTRYNKYTSNNSKTRFPIYLNFMGKGFANIFIVQSLVVVVFIGGILIARTYPGGYVSSLCDKGISYINNGILGKNHIAMEDITDEFIKDNATQVFNEIKSFITMEEKKEDYIKKNYKFPVDIDKGKEISISENKLLINLTNETDVKAAYSGKVKSVIDGDKTTVIINHGDGIEIKYGGLSKDNITEGMDVKVNDIIGKYVDGSDNILSIEVLYMGSMLNPAKCFNLETMK
ncbi:M23 family metallopeptidase [Clostridium sp.]|uniref:M23 family metallopeptidase n=1 Tax=Clostridium sp. TaxID=1506 RepID=UPI003216FA48